MSASPTHREAVATAAPQLPAHAAPLRLDFVLLAIAIAGVSLSAPLIAATAASALAIAFWRNAMAVGVLTPLVLVRHRAELRAVGRRAALLAVASGALLALHFGVCPLDTSYAAEGGSGPCAPEF
ncbi:hypothetical protein AB0K09_31420, partial [Streptomyces sp. NPDC049577]